jgi:hypothetical protein
MAKTKGTLAKVGETLKDAAGTVAKAADDYVVQPVGKAVGLIKPEKAPNKSARKARRKVAARKETSAREAGRKRSR